MDDFNQAMSLDRHFPDTMESLAEAHVLLGNWAEVERLLSARFRLPLNRARSWHLPDLIAAIFRSSADSRAWRQRVGRLAEMAEEVQEERVHKKAQEEGEPARLSASSAALSTLANPFTLLADSLVRSLTKEAYAEASADAVEAWAGVWREVAAGHPDLSLGVRLFEVGVRYLRTKDERILLDLLQEERSILRNLFGLDAGAEEN
jgi:hypothetical protein